MARRQAMNDNSTTSLLISLALFMSGACATRATSVHIEEALQNMQVKEGERAKFVCKVKTSPADDKRLTIHWQYNGVRIPTAASMDHSSPFTRHVQKAERNRHVLIIRGARMRDSGVYTCVASLGADSDKSRARLVVKGPPDPPHNLELTACVGRTAQLQWEEAEDHGSPILRYMVQFNTSDNPDKWHDYFEQFSLLDRVVVELPPWGIYAFRVKSVSALGVSKPSHVTAMTCTIPPERPDSNPKNVRTRTDVKNMLVIEWNPMDRLHFNGPGFQYMVRWRKKGSLDWDSARVDDPTQTHFEREVGEVYDLYEVQVVAVNDMGLSHQPAFVYIGRSGESEPVVSPKDFRLNPNHPPAAHRAYFIWEAVNTSVALIHGKFCGYKLRYWKSVEGRHKQKEVDFVLVAGQKHGPDMRVSVPDLPAYTALRAQVSVMNSHYSGPPSQTIDFFTPEGTPSAVRDLHVDACGVGYVLLKWLPPDYPNGVLQGYDIAYQHISGLAVHKLKRLSPQITHPSTLGARISGLKSHQQYRFYVWARTRAGRGNSTYTDIRTLKGKLPDTPKLQVKELLNSSVNVTWQSDQAPDTHYLLEYRQDGGGSWQTMDYIVNKSWVVLDRPDPVTDYEVRLLARNRLGDMSTSSILKFSTQPQGGSYYYRLDGRDAHPINNAVTFHNHVTGVILMSLMTLTLYDVDL